MEILVSSVDSHVIVPMVLRVTTSLVNVIVEQDGKEVFAMNVSIFIKGCEATNEP